MKTYRVSNLWTDRLIGYFKTDLTESQIDSVEFYRTVAIYFCASSLDDIALDKVQNRQTENYLNEIL